MAKSCRLLRASRGCPRAGGCGAAAALRGRPQPRDGGTGRQHSHDVRRRLWPWNPQHGPFPLRCRSKLPMLSPGAPRRASACTQDSAAGPRQRRPALSDGRIQVILQCVVGKLRTCKWPQEETPAPNARSPGQGVRPAGQTGFTPGPPYRSIALKGFSGAASADTAPGKPQRLSRLSTDDKGTPGVPEGPRSVSPAP